MAARCSCEASHFGSELAYETEDANLGNWQAADDRAIWTVDVPESGRYSGTLFAACDKASAGKPFVLEAGDQRLDANVPDTHIWISYLQCDVGQIDLKAGRQKIVFRSAKKLDGEPIDLKAVFLTRADISD